MADSYIVSIRCSRSVLVVERCSSDSYTPGVISAALNFNAASDGYISNALLICVSAALCRPTSLTSVISCVIDSKGCTVSSFMT